MSKGDKAAVAGLFAMLGGSSGSSGDTQDVNRMIAIWKEDIEGMVVEGLERAAVNMELVAKANAPVRKFRKRGKKYRHGVFVKGVELDFRELDTEDKVTGDIKIGKIVPRAVAIQRMKAIRDRIGQPMGAFNVNDVGAAGMRLSIPKGTRADWAMKWNVKQATLGSASYKGKAPKINYVGAEGESSPTRSRIQKRGIFFDHKSGKFQYGGWLKSQIKADEFATKVSQGVWEIECRSYADYSRPVEYGRNKGDHGTTQGQFFMTKAIDRTFDKIETLIGLPVR